MAVRVKPYDVRGTPSLRTQEEVDEMLSMLFKDLASIAGAAGNNGDIIINKAGAYAGAEGLEWNPVIRGLTIHQPSDTGLMGFYPTPSGYADLLLNARQDSSRNYIPVADSFAYLWHAGSTYSTGIELMWAEAAGVPSGFAKGVGILVTSPSSPNPAGLDIYQYGGLGAGAIGGMQVRVGNNDSGAGAAGTLAPYNKSGTPYYVWPDANGVFRFHTAAPTESGSVSDTVNPGASLAAAKLFVGGSTVAFPMLKNTGAVLQARLGDDSAYALFDALGFKAGGVAGVTDSFQTTVEDITVVGGIITAVVPGGTGASAGGGGYAAALMLGGM